MKLYYSKASPFTRKVLINAIESGVSAKIQIVDLSPNKVFTLPEYYERVNPLFKIPALEVTPDEVIVDSPIICEFIDSIATQRKLLPATGPERFRQLKYQALADGIADAAVLRRYEILREPHLQSRDYDKKQKLKIDTTLRFFDSQFANLSNPYQIGEVALMCSLDYLDFRFAHENWRTENPLLADWYYKAQNWDAFKQTTPH